MTPRCMRPGRGSRQGWQQRCRHERCKAPPALVIHARHAVPV